ncbi:hypothetical protein KGQ34_01330 [Patescibacteria group bacterium]|nr:hypothetical protein [Patescibacteria group bacterium]
MFNDYLRQLSQQSGFDFVRIVLWLKFVSGAISAILFAGVVVIVRKTMALANPIEKLEENILQLGRIPNSILEEHSRSWEAVLAKLESVNASDWKFAVIQADSILDDILKHSGFIGETMGDRLKQINASQLDSLNDIWEAHKVRNDLAHSPDRPLSQEEARRVIGQFEKAFRELKFIE